MSLSDGSVHSLDNSKHGPTFLAGLAGSAPHGSSGQLSLAEEVQDLMGSSRHTSPATSPDAGGIALTTATAVAAAPPETL